MMNMTAKKTEYMCIHEEKLQEHETKLETLGTRIDYKEEKITQILKDNQRMEKKIDKITESIHQLQLNSAQDDFNIDKRVTGLESTVKTLKYIIGLMVSIIAVTISAAVFILTYIH